MQLHDWIRAFLLATSIVTISTILHELAHVAMCRLLKCKIIGFRVLCFNYNGEHFSLSWRGRNHCAFTSSSPKKMKQIVIAGPLIELAVCIGCLVFAIKAEQPWVAWGLYGAAFIVLLSVIYNLLPMTNGDGKMLFGRSDE